jgi:hypothetical protein
VFRDVEAETMNINQAFVELESRTDFALSFEGGALDVEGLLLIHPLPDGTLQITSTSHQGGEWVCDGVGLVSTIKKLLGYFVD